MFKVSGFRDLDAVASSGHLPATCSPGARWLRTVAAARHPGAYRCWRVGHAQRHKLSRHANQESQRQAERQETFQEHHHAGKDMGCSETRSTFLRLTLGSAARHPEGDAMAFYNKVILTPIDRTGDAGQPACWISAAHYRGGGWSRA